jgi:hypothetical protein
VTYSTNGLIGLTNAVTKPGWTLLEEVLPKIVRRWQGRVDFVSKKSVVRNDGTKIVLLSLIVILCCTSVNGRSYA